MLRALIALLLVCVAAVAATMKLYLKDGTYQLAREYKVEGDRVRYYSTERSEWEEIPLSIVDLARTEGDVRRKQEAERAESAAQDAEEKAERKARRESERIPQEKGVYLIAGQEVKPVKQGESTVVTDKKRSILKAMSPLPIVNGKSTLEMSGEHSTTVVTGDRPAFYIRLDRDERFDIVRLALHKSNRVLMKIHVVPVSNEIVVEPDLVETFRKQVDYGVYRIWPTNPLTPGEYAVIEYSDGEVNAQVWDFAYRPK